MASATAADSRRSSSSSVSSTQSNASWSSVRSASPAMPRPAGAGATAAPVSSSSSSSPLLPAVEAAAGAIPLLATPLEPLGSVHILVRSAKVLARLAVGDRNMKICAGVTYKNHGYLTRPTVGLVHESPVPLQVKTSEYFLNVELGVYVENADFMMEQFGTPTNQYNKLAGVALPISVPLLLKDAAPPKAPLERTIELGPKGRAVATMVVHLWFVPDKNPYSAVDDLLLDTDFPVMREALHGEANACSQSTPRALVQYFCFHGRCDDLLRLTVAAEVDASESPTTLLRGTNLRTQILSEYMEATSVEYLQESLGSLLKSIVKDPPDIELDPTKMAAPKDEKQLKETRKRLEKLCDKILKKVASSFSSLPPGAREVCRIVSTAVERRYPGRTQTALSGLLFLRLICPAIIAPERIGITLGKSISPSARRCCIVVAKVIINLVNGVEFGSKEPHMASMNSFLQAYATSYTDLSRRVLDAGAAGAAFDKSMYMRRVPAFVYQEMVRFVGDLAPTLHVSNPAGLQAVQALASRFATPSPASSAALSSPAPPLAPAGPISPSESGSIPSQASVESMSIGSTIVAPNIAAANSSSAPASEGDFSEQSHGKTGGAARGTAAGGSMVVDIARSHVSVSATDMDAQSSDSATF